MASLLKTNTNTINEILNTINNLPEAGSGGVELPTLTNPAEAMQVLAGEQYINENGEAVTGTMPNNGTISTTIDGLNTKTAAIPEGYTAGGTVTVDDTVDNIADEQADLIAQAISALENKVAVTPVLQEKTVSPTTSQQAVTPDSGYDGLSKVTVNAMATATQATPSISVSSAGLITASSTQSAGYVAAGTKSATKQLITQVAQTITPSTSDQTIASGLYLTGTQTIKGDANLVAENIAEGVSIFGVTGTHSGESSGTEGGTPDGPVTDNPSTGSLLNTDFTVKTKKTPMVTNFLASKIISASVDSNSVLNTQTNTSIVYMTYGTAAIGSFIYIKLINSPSSCTVTGDLELMELDLSSHAIVRVAADGEIDNSAGRVISLS